MPQRITCDCGSDEFHVNFVLPSGIETECAKCGHLQPIGETRDMHPGRYE